MLHNKGDGALENTYHDGTPKGFDGMMTSGCIIPKSQEPVASGSEFPFHGFRGIFWVGIATRGISVVNNDRKPEATMEGNVQSRECRMFLVLDRRC